MKKKSAILLGIPIGIINGFFGSGGGIAAVYVLKKFLDVEPKKAHATAIAVILPLSAASLIIYATSLAGNWGVILWAALGGILGGFCGAKVLGKISKMWLRILFGITMIAAGITSAVR
ncbi:MAG: sulfite exporter TauE/SafE family protein [Clostridia bacterium]|nr:sulfite exporter TauE/SafE family protein [Clostridia bacterium]